MKRNNTIDAFFALLRAGLWEENSYLMSVYHKEQPDFLCQSLASVFGQTARASQVVLVEDGPLTPELDEVVADYSSKYPEIEVVPLLENRGLGLALAEGILHCKYEIVARMDTDDIAREDRFELQLKEFEKNPQLDICGSHVKEFEDDVNVVVTQRKVPLTDEDCKKYQKRRAEKVIYMIIMINLKLTLSV